MCTCDNNFNGDIYSEVPRETEFDIVSMNTTLLTIATTMEAGKVVYKLTPAESQAGEDGKEIELQKSLTHIQWRYVGDEEWINLVALTDLVGPSGEDGSQGNTGNPGRNVAVYLSGSEPTGGTYYNGDIWIEP